MADYAVQLGSFTGLRGIERNTSRVDWKKVKKVLVKVARFLTDRRMEVMVFDSKDQYYRSAVEHSLSSFRAK